MNPGIKKLIISLIFFIHFVFSQEFILHSKHNKKIVFNLLNLKNNSMYIFKNHVTCMPCYSYLFDYADEKKYKLFLISSATKSSIHKKQIIKEIKKIYKGRIIFYFEINENLEEVILNKPGENGIFQYYNIFKCPAVLLKRNDSVFFYSYDDIFINNKLI
jgi:hypothetical protein